MYIVNRDNKKVNKIKDISFSEIGLKERKDLQEWIANNPDLLDEELLIIQKEFDGFNDTNERLDLMALDKKGNIVVIENKLDDSGKDVVWQALKYAGYCSSLNKENIKTIYQQYLIKCGKEGNAEDLITSFLDKSDFSEVELNQNLTQRIILVAKEFRKEVTNTVIWARKYGMDIRCMKIIPYLLNDELIVDTDEIIPGKDIADIIISYDKKAQEDYKDKEEATKGQIIHDKFWHQFIPEFNKKSPLFSGKNIDLKQYDNWYSTGAGISGICYTFTVTKKNASVQIDLCSYYKDDNKKSFAYFYQFKDEIENLFGDKLEWDEMPDNKTSRIRYSLNNVNINNEEDWNEIMEFLSTNMIKLNNIFKKYITNYANVLKNN